MVTLAEIKRSYNGCDCKQVGNKQLFIVEGDINGVYQTILLSYYTKIGRFVNGTWFITNERYSSTTSKQTSQFINSTAYTVIRLDDISLASIKEYLNHE